MKKLLYFLTLLVATALFAAADTPAPVSDTAAWEAVLTAACDRPAHTEVEKAARSAYRKSNHIDALAPQFAAFCATYDDMIARYNKANQHADESVQAVFLGRLGAFIKITVAGIRSTPQSDGTVKDAVYHQHGKAKLQSASWTDTISAGGYTSYATASIDSTYLYSTVQISGSSTSMGCTWDNYHDQWQPPGCPATHTPQINNYLGSVGGSFTGGGGLYTNYITFSNTQQTAYVPGSGDYSWNAGTGIFCSVAKMFILTWIPPPTIWKIAYAKARWNGGKTGPTCSVGNYCSNNPPWMLPMAKIIVGNSPCSNYWDCVALCRYRSGLWTCPPLADICIPSDASEAICTPAQ